MTSRVLAATATLLLVLAAPAANAHVQSERDPDDVRGHLDMAKVSFDHDLVSWTFTMTSHDGWAPKAIGGVNGGINVYLDTAGDDRLNYYIVFSKEKKKVVCTIYNRKGELKSEGDANKTSGKTVSCEIRSNSLQRDTKNVKWAFQTSWKLSKDVYEFDYAPNEGYAKHKVPN